MGVYLVTGGAGFIGSNLVAKLLHEGNIVHALDLNEAPAELVHPNLNWFQGDLLDAGVVAASLEGVDAIIHLAAQTSVPVSIAHPEMTHEVNVLGTELLIEQCRFMGVQRLLLASSAAVYGDCGDLPLTEDKAGTLLSPYAQSKWTNEHQLNNAKGDDLDVIAMRFFNVYGTHVSKEKAVGGVIGAFVRAMMTESPLQIYGDGEQTRDFVHVSDVCDAILSLLASEEKYDDLAVNICSGTQTNLLELVNIIQHELVSQGHVFTPVVPSFSPFLPGDIQHSLGSNALLRELVTWHPKYTLKEGIKGIVSASAEGGA